MAATISLDAGRRAIGSHGRVIEYPVSGDIIACSDVHRLKCAAAAAIRNTPALLTEARGWILDAYSLEPEDLEHYTPAKVLVTLQRGYEGGCTAFYLNSLQLTPHTTRKA